MICRHTWIRTDTMRCIDCGRRRPRQWLADWMARAAVAVDPDAAHEPWVLRAARRAGSPVALGATELDADHPDYREEWRP